jgi:hypothetical protein
MAVPLPLMRQVFAPFYRSIPSTWLARTCLSVPHPSAWLARTNVSICPHPLAWLARMCLSVPHPLAWLARMCLSVPHPSAWLARVYRSDPIPRHGSHECVYLFPSLGMAWTRVSICPIPRHGSHACIDLTPSLGVACTHMSVCMTHSTFDWYEVRQTSGIGICSV